MSHEYSPRMSKQQKHPRVHFQQYLYNAREPRDDLLSDLPAELEAELLENSHDMRRHVRRLARTIRRHQE